MVADVVFDVPSPDSDLVVLIMEVEVEALVIDGAVEKEVVVGEFGVCEIVVVVVGAELVGVETIVVVDVGVEVVVVGVVVVVGIGVVTVVDESTSIFSPLPDLKSVVVELVEVVEIVVEDEVVVVDEGVVLMVVFIVVMEDPITPKVVFKVVRVTAVGLLVGLV